MELTETLTKLTEEVARLFAELPAGELEILAKPENRAVLLWGIEKRAIPIALGKPIPPPRSNTRS